MKTTVYLRVGHSARGTKVQATATPSQAPLKLGDKELPTVAFAVELDIPNALFKQAERVVARLTIPEEAARIVAGVDLMAGLPAPLPTDAQEGRNDA